MNPGLARTLTITGGPLLFFIFLITLPGTFFSKDAAAVMALGSWMIIWWVTEPLPIPITSLLPLVILPLLGVTTVKDVAQP